MTFACNTSVQLVPLTLFRAAGNRQHKYRPIERGRRSRCFRRAGRPARIKRCAKCRRSRSDRVRREGKAHSEYDSGGVTTYAITQREYDRFRRLPDAIFRCCHSVGLAQESCLPALSVIRATGPYPHSQNFRFANVTRTSGLALTINSLIHFRNRPRLCENPIDAMILLLNRRGK
jgi:hypothetical protein